MEDVAILPRPVERSGRRQHRPAFVQRYWAFLSYSHLDEATAAWLHKELENYKVPKRLVGRGTPFGLIPSRLSPVFRDRHELAAGGDLRDDIADALAASRFLVVLCSPASAGSRWTNEEIRLFKQLRPDGEVLAAIVEGEPWAAEIAGRESEECFPPALKVEVDAAGRLTDERAEPIAADLRAGRDGRRAGLLKLIAGMLDVGLDELVQRETHRRHRRMMAVTGASVLGMIVAAGLAVTAVQARDEARDQRREAEGLIGFMLGDLRDKLEPIGRLDALDSVGARALAYYEKQDKGSLGDDSLAQRSRALTMIGQLANQRGDLAGALRRYREASAATGELLRRDPDNPERVFDHAQNVFWVGETAMQRGELGLAERHMREYAALAARMVAIEPNNPKYRLEQRYAQTNLGLMLDEQNRAADAVPLFRDALAANAVLLSTDPANADYRLGPGETQAWLADALLRSGDPAAATIERGRLRDYLAPLVQPATSDSNLKRQQASNLIKLAQLFKARGDFIGARRELAQATALIEGLLAIEPNDSVFLETRTTELFEGADLALLEGEAGQALQKTELGCAIADGAFRRDPTIYTWRVERRAFCLMLRARLVSEAGDARRGAELAGQAAALARDERPTPVTLRWRNLYAKTAGLQAVLLARSGQGDEAAGRLREVAQAIGGPARDPQQIALLQLAARGLGRRDVERRLSGQMSAMGYRDSWLTRDLAALGRPQG